MLKRLTPVIIFFLLPFLSIFGQNTLPEISYSGKPRKFEIAEIAVTGDLNNDPAILSSLSGLRVGQEISVPGEEITKAIKKYWEFGLFSNVNISASKIEGRFIYLTIALQERPRLSEMFVEGLKKSDKEAVIEKIDMMKGSQVTPYLVSRAERFIKSHFVEKGFYNTEVTIVQRDDPNKKNHVFLDITVDKKDKVKVRTIEFEGNENFTARRLNRYMKKTNEKGKILNFFQTKKFVNEEYQKDLDKIIEKYNEKGYRDATIAYDSVSRNDDNTVDVKIGLEEGRKYYFGNITWIGNTVYPSELLTQELRIAKGDVFNQTLLDERLFSEDDAVHNLYMNNGYLFSRIVPVDIRIEADTVDLEMRIFEGEQATINAVIIKGNTKTHEHVVRRELRTKPGELFSKEAIVRSIRELAQLGHFDPEKMNPVPLPDQEKGTVDIEYNLEEKANDQIELSGGWGANMFVGSLGLKFSNFSIRNMFNKTAWRPLPSGDGQALALRAQTQGKYYQSYSISFTEPWLGGKKPNSLSVSLYRTIQTGMNSNYGYSGYGYGGYGGIPDYNENQYLKTLGISVGFGKRLTWPDDYFSIYTEASYQVYDVKNWPYLQLQNGLSHTLKFKLMLSRRSIDNPLYTRSGSDFSAGVEFTPPYSLFSDKDYSKVTDTRELYRLIEYHKWTLKGAMFKPLDNKSKLVVMGKFEYGFLGYYNKYLKSPYEKYLLGGDGMAGYSFSGTETVGLRGYENGSLTALNTRMVDGREVQYQDANMYSKLTMELRYPLTLQPSATVYGILFAEAGDSWSQFQDFNPFNLKRSAGVGLRIFLPMFGLMGIDWGYGFDDVPYRTDAGGSQFHFVMGQSF
jgi:outer membrane protein insertion porin family